MLHLTLFSSNSSFCCINVLFLLFFIRTKIWWISTYLSSLVLNQTRAMLQCWALWYSFAQLRKRLILLNATR